MLIISGPGYIRIGGRTRTSIDSTSPKRGRTSGGVGVGVDKQVCFGDRIPDPDLHSALLHSARRRSSRDSVCFEGEILPIVRPDYFSIEGRNIIRRGRTSGGVDRQPYFGDRIPDPDLISARRRSSRKSRCGEGEILPIGRPVYIYIRIGRTSVGGGGGGGVERHLCFGESIPDLDLRCARLHRARRRSSRVSRC